MSDFNGFACIVAALAVAWLVYYLRKLRGDWE